MPTPRSPEPRHASPAPVERAGTISRRDLLARSGVLAAAVTLSPGLLVRPPEAEASTWFRRRVREMFDAVTLETYQGLVAFSVPGDDAYSQHQGHTAQGPGAVEAETAEFVALTLDEFLPAPDQVIRPVVRALAVGLDEEGLRLSSRLRERFLGRLLLRTLDRLGDAVRDLIANDETIPMSGLIALLLNLVATTVDRDATRGPFDAPFANLSFEDKAEVFRRLEEPLPELVELIDGNLPEPLFHSVSGLLRFAATALLMLSAFGAYNESQVFDPDQRRVTERPLGWDLSNYLPGMTDPPDGWDEFIGYYEDRRSVES